MEMSKIDIVHRFKGNRGVEWRSSSQSTDQPLDEDGLNRSSSKDVTATTQSLLLTGSAQYFLNQFLSIKCLKIVKKKISCLQIPYFV